MKYYVTLLCGRGSVPLNQGRPYDSKEAAEHAVNWWPWSYVIEELPR